MTFFYMKQLPILPPSAYANQSTWLLPRVLELTYTAWDLAPFARDLGYSGPPFPWDEGRRFQLRCEIDAAFFHLYGLSRDDAGYILETFPIVKRNDEKRHGEYRTKRAILERYGAMQTAMETGKPYQTILDPPPAHPSAAHPPNADRAPAGVAAEAKELPFRRVESPPEAEKYRTLVPVTTLKAAAGAFGESQAVQFDGWAEVKTRRKLHPGMFLAQVAGHSMEPLIPDGAWCLFVASTAGNVAGTRQGKILLVQHRAIQDPETGGIYTVKRYESKKIKSNDGAWRHQKIRLLPENPDFQPIVITGIEEGEVLVIAEFVEVLEGGE